MPSSSPSWLPNCCVVCILIQHGELLKVQRHVCVCPLFKKVFVNLRLNFLLLTVRMACVNKGFLSSSWLREGSLSCFSTSQHLSCLGEVHFVLENKLSQVLSHIINPCQRFKNRNELKQLSISFVIVPADCRKRTLYMEKIRSRTIVNDDHISQIPIQSRQILHKNPIEESAVFSE